MLRSLPRWTFLFGAAPLLCACSSGAEAPDAEWTAAFSDPSGAAFTLLAVDPAGAVALAGNFVSQLNLGDVALPGAASLDNAFVGRLDPDGQVAWGVTGGNSGGQTATGVAFEPDGDVIVAGGFTTSVDFGTGPLTALSSDVFVARLGAGGHPVWVKQFSADDGGPSGAGDSTPAGVAVDGAGNIALGGSFSGTLGFGGPPLFAAAETADTSFVAELDQDGGFVFSQAFGGQGNAVSAVAFDGAGNVFVGGVDRGSLVIGNSSFTSAGTSGYVAKLTPRGEVTWALQLGGEGTSEVVALAVDPSGDVLLGGNYGGAITAGNLPPPSTPPAETGGFLLQISGDGTPQWLTLLAGTQLGAITAATGGGALITGAYQGPPSSGQGALPPLTPPGAFAARVDGQGSLVRTLVFGTTGINYGGFQGLSSAGTGIGVAGEDAVIAGTFGAPLQIDPTWLQPVGPGDLFATRRPL